MKFLTQAAKALQEKKKYQRRLAIFLCLALVVTLGTFAALKLRGQAMTHQRKVLKCQLEIHQHLEECYNKEDKAKLICGQADYVAHKHNDDCYNLDSGELVCHIKELEIHKHDDTCYQEEKVLVCKEAETAAHAHTPECYTRERGDLQCVLEEHMHMETCYSRENSGLQCLSEEHVHTETCYDETGALICQIEEHQHNDNCYIWTETLNCLLEEHQHNDDCYAWTETLTCQQEESESSHTHTDACYETKKTLVCEKEEVELHTHDENCWDENGVLICEKLQVEEHIHGAECFETVELSDEEVAALNTPGPDDEASASENSVSSNSTNDHSASANSASENSASENAVSDNETGHVHDESCYDSAGGLMCGFEGETPDITKVCETEDYIVTAVYKDDAEIPEEVELLAELITADKDEEHYAKREAEIKEALKDENVSMNALFKIGFYVDGKEVEPKKDVNITIQFLDENGLAEGSPIAVIHFADGGNKVLNGGKAKNKSTTFKTGSFSEFGIVEGYEVPEEEEEEETEEGEAEEKKEEKEVIQTTIPISESYEYKNDLLQAVFRIEGEVSVSVNGTETKAPVEEEETTVSIDEQVSNNVVRTEENKEEIAVSTNEENQEEEIPVSVNEAASGEEITDGAPKEITEAEEEAKSKDSETIEDLSQKLEFKVEPIDETMQEYAKDYAAVTACLEEISDKEDQVMVQVLAYSLNYGDEKLDLSDCKVTVEFTPTQALVKKAKESIGKTPDGEELSNELTLSVIQSVKSMDAGEEDSAPAEETRISENEADEKQETRVSENETGEREETKESNDGPDPEDLQSMGKIMNAAPVKEMNQPMIVTLDTSSNGTAVFAALGSSQANPKFTVEYYAYIDEFATESSSSITPLPVIDTSGRKMPENDGTAKADKQVFVSENGTVEMSNKLKEVYSCGKYYYVQAPGLVYFNKIAKNKNYELINIQVQEDGSNVWTDHSLENGKEWHFTNKQKTANEHNNFILINENATVRLIYKVVEKMVNAPTNFYDYDISDGSLYLYNEKANTLSSVSRNSSTTTHDSGDIWYMYTNRQGINSNSANQTFGFGNSESSVKTTMGEIEGNRANANNSSAGSATFEMVTGLKDGKIQYAENVIAPNLFNDGDAIGKTSYSGNLIFSQKGDTYTLTGANVSENNQIVSSVKGLDKFRKQWNWNNTRYFAANSFYPLDTVSSAGSLGHDLKFGSPSSTKVIKNFSNMQNAKDSLFAPASDDKMNHNHYFGMHYTVEFELVKDYVGPLEYLFYGDDDMWVFLDRVEGKGDNQDYKGKLICDIGGVHSAIGEYVNLRDYLPVGTEGKYKLSFFYTERGASGSTCWMQFTLPSVSFATTEQETGQVKIEKKVTSSETTDEEFGFKAEFTDENGNPLKNDYSYTKYDSKTGKPIDTDVLIWNDAKFTLKADEYIVISYLPEGSHYTITEVGPVKVTSEKDPGNGIEWKEEQTNNYNPEISGGTPIGTGKTTGTVGKGTTVEVKYNNVRIYELPETGGSGPMLYTIAGALCIMFGTGFLYRKKSRERRI